MAQFMLSLLLDADLREIDLDVTGVNHLPIITDMRHRRRRRARDACATCSPTPRRAATSRCTLPRGSVTRQHSFGGECTKRDVARPQPREVRAVRPLRRAARARATAISSSSSPGFLTEESDWGTRWGVQLTDDRRPRSAGRTSTTPSSTKLHGRARGPRHAVGRDGRAGRSTRSCATSRATSRSTCRTPGQCPDLPTDVVVESMCTADGDGLRGRDEPRRRRRCSPTGCAASSPAQEATVEAAVTGNRDKVVDAMLARPARRPHRLRPPRADDRRDARGTTKPGSRSSRERLARRAS